MDEEERAGFEKRYGFLLQPIKDLAANWNVDIGKYLDQFLESVKAVQMEQLEKGRRFNFNEAAMILQSTTSTYDKKVEFVYQIAVGAFDNLEKKKKSKKDKKNDGDAEDGGQDEACFADDSVSGEEQGTVIRPSGDICEIIDYSNLRLAEPKRSQQTQKKFPEVHRLRPMPAEFLPLLDEEKLGVRLFAKNGEFIGNREDFLINTLPFNDRGALLLDLQNDQLLDDYMDEETIREVSVRVVDGFKSDEASGDDGRKENEAAAEDEFEADRGTENGNVSVMRDLDLQSCQGFPTAKDEAHECVRKSCASEAVDEADCDGGFDDHNSTALMHTQKQLQYHSEDEGPADYDEIPVLDPFEPMHYYHAPLKIIKPFVMPEQVAKREARRRGKAGLPEKESLLEFLNSCLYRKKTRVDSSVGRIFRSDLLSACRMALSEFFDREFKLWKATAKNVRCDEHLVRNVVEYDEDDAYDDDGNGGDDFMDGDGFNAEGAEPCEYDDELGEFARIMKEKDIDVENSYCPAMFMPETSADEEEADDIYPCAVRSRLEDYWKKGEEARSSVAKHVQRWESELLPLLEEEERRREFNIHKYSSELLENFADIGDGKSFVELMAASESVLPRHEISRYFLSSLMLINGQNLRFMEVADGDGEGTEKENRMSIEQMAYRALTEKKGGDELLGDDTAVSFYDGWNLNYELLKRRGESESEDVDG